jgi:MFS superfamily sulfate permease-like transporter
MKKHYYITILAILSFAAAIYDVTAGIYIAVLANVVANIITVSRQKSKTTIKRVKKERPMTVDEFREREMEANPHRPYPRHQEGDVYK